MKTHKLTIDALNTQGEGIARLDGKAIFVPFVLPGETCDATIIEKHKTYDRAMPQAVYDNEAQTLLYTKTNPECPVFGVCGGCQLQHIAYEDQLIIKTQWLIETFQRISHLEINPSPMVASQPYAYRNKVSIPIYAEQDELKLGYNIIYQAGKFIAIDDCPIAAEPIRQIMQPLRNTLNQCNLILKRASKNDPKRSRAIIRSQKDSLRLHIENVLFDESDISIIDEQLIQTKLIDEIGIYLLSKDKSITPKLIKQENLETETDLDSFMQVNDSIRDHLYNAILNLPYQNAQLILDGYCGTGLLTAQLADKFAKVIGIESNPTSSNDAKARIKKLGLSKQVEIHQRSFEGYLFNVKRTFPAVILNPPRAGLSPEAVKATLLKKPADVVLVSCHPAALARDVKSFVENGYQLVSIQPFDMFPQTYHYEVLCYLKRNTPPSP